MTGVKTGRWLTLGFIVLALFGGCTLLAGGVDGQWAPSFLIWIGLVVPLKLLNDRIQAMKWPMEFLMWSVILLMTVNLLWLKFGVPE